MIQNPRKHWCATLGHIETPGSNPGSGTSVTPASTPLWPAGGLQADSNSLTRWICGSSPAGRNRQSSEARRYLQEGMRDD